MYMEKGNYLHVGVTDEKGWRMVNRRSTLANVPTDKMKLFLSLWDCTKGVRKDGTIFRQYQQWCVGEEGNMVNTKIVGVMTIRSIYVEECPCTNALGTYGGWITCNMA